MRPEIQCMLREEVTETYEAARARGDEDLTPGDIDNLPFTNAVVKVSQPPPLKLTKKEKLSRSSRKF